MRTGEAHGRDEMRPVLWRCVVVGVVIGLLNVALTDSRVRPLYAEFDKLVHAPVFFVITLLIRWCTRLPLVWVVLLAMMLGAVDELMQVGMPGRSADWADWAADCVGVVLAGLVLYFWTNLKRRANRPVGASAWRSG